VQIPLYDPASGAQVGSMVARLHLSALLPIGLGWPGAGGSILALFDENGTTPLLPLSIDSELFASDAFDWGGDRWIVVRRQLHEPSLRFATAAPLAPITEPFTRAARRGAVALLVVLAAGIVLSILLTRRVTSPLERMAVATHRVAQGNFEQRVDEGGPEELRRLGRAFNTMTESLQATLQKLSQREAVAAVGEFAAALAHEVRNPLTSIRLDLERACERLEDPVRADALLRRALSEVDRLNATVSGSLRIARSGSLTLSIIDLRHPVRAAIDAADPHFAARGARLDRWEAPVAPVLVRGNAGALEQLFLNLLLNAAEALPAGGSAQVTVDDAPEGVRVLVQDDGAGIAAESLERIREPFFTTKENGTGLGLAIGERIARAHGTDLHFASTPGHGTTASITLARDRGSADTAETTSD
jgi:signal transduction histidine kinase